VTASGTSKALRAAAAVLVAALVLLSVARAARSWPREAHLSYAEGIWIGLASDAAHGVFYRPLDGPLGYGGTRYLPLFFVAHGGLICPEIEFFGIGRCCQQSADEPGRTNHDGNNRQQRS
jgi:hypothetical protein